MFKIKKEKFGSFQKYKLINQNTGESASIIPDFGANVNELVLKKKDKLIQVIEGDKNTKELKKNAWFKGAKLNPFPNRTKDGKYKFENKTYQLPINFKVQDHAIHGLLYNKKFKVKKKISSKTKASLILSYNYNKESKGFPFKFKTEIEYTLSDRGLEVKTKVTNKGNTKMPFADGWHPYFKLDDKINNLYLKIPSAKQILVDKRMIPTGKTKKLSKFRKLEKINKTNFDTGFACNKSKIIETSIYSKKSNTKLILWQEGGKNRYNFLQVFIPPKRDSIAIEPMTSNTNALNNKEGLIILKPNQKFNSKYGVTLK